MPLFGRTTERDEQRAVAWGEWLRQRNPLAVISLVLGILSLIELGALIVPGVASIILGTIALRQLRRPENPDLRGHRLAWAGIIISTLSLICAGILYFLKYRG